MYPSNKRGLCTRHKITQNAVTGLLKTNETKPNTTLSITSTARCSGMPRLSLIRHSSLVLLLEELFCSFTVGAGKRSGQKITIQAANSGGDEMDGREWQENDRILRR